MKFAEIIEGLKNGHVYYRSDGWWPEQRFIAAHVPQSISAGIVERMTSISDEAKQLVDFLADGCNSPGIDFHDQVLEFREQAVTHASATAYIPTWEDIFADDWTQWVEPVESSEDEED